MAVEGAVIVCRSCGNGVHCEEGIVVALWQVCNELLDLGGECQYVTHGIEFEEAQNGGDQSIIVLEIGAMHGE